MCAMHTAHRSKRVSRYLASKPVEVLYLPTNCSGLNSVERVWSKFKRMLEHRCYREEQRNGRAFEAAIRETLEEIPVGSYQRIAQWANLQDLKSALMQEFDWAALEAEPED